MMETSCLGDDMVGTTGVPCLNTTTDMISSSQLSSWKASENFYFYLDVMLYSFLLCFGCLGNVIIIVVLSRDRAFRNVSNLFLLSKAIADLLLVIVCTPIEMAKLYMPEYDEGGIFCRVGYFIEVLSAMASVLNLVAVSAERYIVIVHPIHARLYCTQRNCRRAVLILWLVAIILAAPCLTTLDVDAFTMSTPPHNTTIYICFERESTALLISSYHIGTLLVLPFIWMLYAYSGVIVTLWTSLSGFPLMADSHCSAERVSFLRRSMKELKKRTSDAFGPKNAPSGPRGSADVDQQRSATYTKLQNQISQTRKKVIKMLICAIFLFLACWGPKLVLNLLTRCGIVAPAANALELKFIKKTFNVLPFIHASINSLVYLLMSSSFKKFRSAVQSFSRCSSRESSGSSFTCFPLGCVKCGEETTETSSEILQQEIKPPRGNQDNAVEMTNLAGPEFSKARKFSYVVVRRPERSAKSSSGKSRQGSSLPTDYTPYDIDEIIMGKYSASTTDP